MGEIPEDVLEDMSEIAPMLETLGYDPEAIQPKYGEADRFVIENTNEIKAHDKEWEEVV